MTKPVQLTNQLGLAALPSRTQAAPSLARAARSDERLPVGQAVIIMLVASGLMWAGIIATGIHFI
ncbi:MAG: hypothetical protein POH28_08670, partial [Acidocella sp.]|nr:hypothetical protein [Acidocella sp.]